PAASRDCNSNGIPDECDVEGGASQDANGNGKPDECEVGPARVEIIAPRGLRVGGLPVDVVPGDIDGDGITDLVAVCKDSDPVYILKGAGGGDFLPARGVEYTDYGGRPWGVSLGD